MKRVILITWAFAAVVALLNLDTLWPLIVTPLALISFTKWMGFLVVPLACAAIVAVALTLMIRRNSIAINLAFWVAFFVAVELWHARQVARAAPLNSVCSEQNLFVQSLMIAGDEYQFMPHAAAVTVDGRVMLWSYSELAFWEASRAAYENLDFKECRASVQALK